MMNVFDQIKWNDQGLIPAILQDNNTMKVVMMAWMNKEALSKTIETKRCYFYSRSRNKIWLKGEESGNFHNVESILVDCDFDSLLVKVNERVAYHVIREGIHVFIMKLLIMELQ